MGLVCNSIKEAIRVHGRVNIVFAFGTVLQMLDINLFECFRRHPKRQNLILAAFGRNYGQYVK